ncbi:MULTISPECIES: DinI-like family protein [Klebsiella]|uniref:DinI-like family protein n=1 Tax=Klebsiella pneumoniae complex TaxID=3390273 RepID=UPI00098384E8|nr:MULTISPECIES: DinI-like family protein [Klebsiella]MBP2922411.1 DinI family protein [Klebsiella pneumoniae]OKN32334.1 SOS operon TUM protein [Klebsiella pneumoniae]QTX36875.1 DinI family protein [Klebsiella pneumoniae]HBW1145670.1 DinI family protein [Klebsiella pneumoniae]HCI6072545.1 DinI family protein [Klebsiella pneumoniae]
MDRELNEHVMIERVEMIARLTAEGTCKERDREIALNLIAEIARGNLMKNNNFSVVFAVPSIDEPFTREGKVKVNITLDKDQQIGQPIIDAFQRELSRRIQSVFPSTSVTVKKGSMTGVELIGFDKDSDREALDSILQEVWEDESWR